MNYLEKLDNFVVSHDIRKRRETIEGLLDEIEEKTGYLAAQDPPASAHDIPAWKTESEGYQQTIVWAVEQIRGLIEVPR